MYSSVYGCRPTYPWRPSHALRTSQRYDNFAITQTAARFLQGNRIKLWPRQGFHEGNLVKSLHGIDVS